MRRLRYLLLVLVASTGLLGGVLAAPAHAAGVPVLVDVRTGHHPGFDRIVFDFDGPVPDRTRTRWVDEVRFDGTGVRMNLHGNAFLEVSMSATGYYHGLTYRDPVRALALPNLNHMVSAGGHDGRITVGLGLMQRTTVLRTFTLTDPSRYVVDVSTDYPQTWARVQFVDAERAANHEGHGVRSVLRRVPVPAVARGQLHRLYAGPTAAEARDGLSLVTSVLQPGDPATSEDRAGFRGLRVADRVAHVTLTGTCWGFGQRYTVYDELFTTLRYWPTVDYVKVYDARGRTQDLTPGQPSFPECLEPDFPRPPWT